MDARVAKKHRARRQDAATVSSSSSSNQMTTYAVPGLVVTDHSISVPFDYSDPSSSHGDASSQAQKNNKTTTTISVFFRTVTHRNKVEDSSLPYLLYLQGGPGFESPRPMDCSGWLKSAVNYFRVVLMDQRGTGLSHGITADSLLLVGTPEQQARYLKCFRADSIVRDAEAIRAALMPPGSRVDTRWSILGQSFGGFCCVTYLSVAPESLAEVIMTGGLPPGISLPCAADEVYRRTFRRVLLQNSKFYSRFPAAEQRARDVVTYLAAQPDGAIVTPGGNTLSPRSFQLLGLQCLGFAHGFERLNYLLEAAVDSATGSVSQRFLKDFDGWMAWDTNPLYALLHESIYCQGEASHWAAHRVRNEVEYRDAFDAVLAASTGAPVMFTGEMVFPWMFDEFRELKKVKAAAALVAAETQWPSLYCEDVLQKNTVPVAAASYFEDIFVDFELAQETVAKVGGVRQHITNEYLHDGIRESGPALFEKLLNMVRGGILLR